MAQGTVNENETGPGEYWTYLGGLIAVAIALGISLLSGSIYSGAEAREMINALSNSALRFGMAVATSSATILALMLTLVGMSRSADETFGGDLYHRVLRLVTLATVTLCGAIFLLLILSLPVGEFEKLPESWYPVYYWILVGLVAGLTGLIITVVLMLYSAVRRVVITLSPI